MDELHRDDLFRPCGAEITSHKSPVDLPVKIRERKRVTFREDLTYSSVLENSRSRGTVLLEFYRLAVLLRDRHLHTASKAGSKVVGLGWGLLALLCKNNGVSSAPKKCTYLLASQCVCIQVVCMI